MPSAKELRVEPIASRDAMAFVRKHHYSGKVDPRSQLHLGVFLRGRLEGCMQFGPSIDKNLHKLTEIHCIKVESTLSQLSLMLEP